VECLHDSNFFALLLHVVVKSCCALDFTHPTSGMEELETVKLSVLLLLKPHEPSDTKSESFQHALVALHKLSDHQLLQFHIDPKIDPGLVYHTFRSDNRYAISDSLSLLLSFLSNFFLLLFVATLNSDL
jgi:hypothetical protein